LFCPSAKGKNQTKSGPSPGSAATAFGKAIRVVSSENWHEERDRLVQLLDAIKVAALRDRLAKLNARLGEDET
jgi:hypothetical protein